MTAPLVSIIVPVWNTARFLPECLDSLLGQTLQDIEIICVDDASTDGSLLLLQQYAARDQRVRPFSLSKCRCPGGARNYGITMARADFIGFVDSDDLISLDYFANLYQGMIAHTADIVFTSYTVFDESTREFAFGGDGTAWQRLRHRLVHNVRGLNKAFSPGWDQNRDFSDLRVELSIFPTVLNKLYRSSLLDKVKFPEGILYEDILFTPQVLHHAQRVYSCPGGEYYYRRNSGSITRRKKSGDLMEKLIVAGMLDLWVQQLEISTTEKKEYENLVARKYRQAVKGLAKHIIFWTPSRIAWIKSQSPPAVFRIFVKSLWVRLLLICILVAILAILALFISGYRGTL